MNKPPAFQFYAQDFLTGVVYLTNDEIGIYIKMLCKQWTDGQIPKKRLGFLVGLDWDKFSDELKSKFTDKGDYLVNERLEKEREKKVLFHEKQKENGKKGGRPKSKKPTKPNDTEDNKPKPLIRVNPNKSQKNPLEDEYEIEDEYENIKIKKVEKQKLIEKFGNEGYYWMINKLSNYKLSSGKKYKSDYGAINSWVSDKWENEKNVAPKKEKLNAGELIKQKYGL
jgi:uncharacterized protein YdaU (DUF1376 family)